MLLYLQNVFLSISNEDLHRLLFGSFVRYNLVILRKEFSDIMFAISEYFYKKVRVIFLIVFCIALRIIN